MPRHILKADDFDQSLLEALFKQADWIRTAFHDNSGGRDYLRRKYARKLLHYVFGEPSTRTRLSFCSAALHFGMTVEGTDNIEFSSRKKGESWEAMGRVLSGYQPDVIVSRMMKAGDVDKFATYSRCWVVNGGDGDNEHPTQMLVDLYTIRREFSRLNGLHIGVGGDLYRGRTVHSLVKKMMEVEGVTFSFFSPPNLRLPDPIKTMLNNKGIRYTEHTEITPEAISLVDVFYHTRAQDEREGGNMAEPLVIGREQLSWMKEEAILMHPLPIGPGREITVEAENQGCITNLAERDPVFRRVRCFEQSDNGLWVRMALLQYLLDGGLQKMEALEQGE